jgi:hypothetical protein
MRACAVALAICLAATLAGCSLGGDGGGEKHSEAEAGSEHERESREKREAAKGIPAADQVAYYQLAVGSGLLRAAAVEAEGGRALRGRRRAELRDVRRRVEALAPGDRGLVRARRDLLPEVRRLLDASSASRRRAAVRRVLSTCDAVNVRLRRFLRENPGIGASVPD